MLQLSHLRKSFGQILAVDDLSLDIRPGEIFGLLGPNGAGKTTTVSMAVGLLKPDAGAVQVDGADPRLASTRSRLGVATQALALYDDLTGEENLRFFGKIQGFSDPKLTQRVAWVLEFAQLTDRRKDRVKTYSGGMQRRLNLAVAPVHEPPILLLDEPTVGVDPQSRNAIFEAILALRREGRAILFTTHYMEEAQRLCDRVGIMDGGKLLALDTVENLIRDHGGRDLLIVERDSGEERFETEDPLKELEKLRLQGPLRRFRVERPDLETVFLKLTGKTLRD
jgi:ABC-2 type transport system ATP-binding protein